MSNVIRHHLSFPLGKPPRLPPYLSEYTQFDASFKQFSIRGDVSGAPTPQILDALIEQGTKLSSPFWRISLEGDPNHACAFEIQLSLSGDRRDVRLLNPCDDLQDPSIPPLWATMRPDRDVILSKKPQGPLSVIANNLLASDSALQSLGLAPCAAVLVNREPVGWHLVQPKKHALLDPNLSFSRSNHQPYRTHLTNIAKADTDLAFGVATESEGWGENLVANIFLIETASAARIFPTSRKTLGDVTLTSVFPYDSPEGELMQSLTERVNRLIK